MPFGSYGEKVMSPLQSGASKPWGLSDEDKKTIESLTNPAAGEGAEIGKDGNKRQEGSRGSRINVSSQSALQDTAGPGSDGFERSNAQLNKLTHVKSTGEAHMVDVGQKNSTKRIAIALGQVRFSNTEVLKLIEDNANKKGDVLGVARIAGIMAAKRTADIIPLCHPIAISRVEVNCSLVPGAPRHRLQNRAYWSAPSGAVILQARVECVGPTGVEMEAMTAVHAAMLTVYDMCKAVDKSMGTSSRVVFKTGGRSGTWSDGTWRDTVCGRYFNSQTDDIEHLLAGKDGGS